MRNEVNQGFLLPPSLRDWLPEDHLAWFIRDSADSLDVDALLDHYRQCGKGELPYDPRMMLRVLIYAYSTGTFSSRKIAGQLEENAAYRVLAENQMPKHRTIARFCQTHLDKFSELFAQAVRLAAESGLAKVGTLAIDGSRPKANASKHKAMSYDRMNKEEKKLKKELRAITKMAAEVDDAEDVEFGDDFRGGELPEELARREGRLKTIQEAKKRLEKRKAEEAKKVDAARKKAAEKDGRKPPQDRTKARQSTKGKPKPKDQENFTDPDSRIMKTSNGYQQSFNAQIAVDGKSQLIVATKVTNCASDTPELIPMIELAMANTKQPVDRVLADAGYRSEPKFTELESAGIDGYIPVGRANDSNVADDAPATQRIQRKVATKRGRSRHRRRKHLVESPFGWAKNVLGFRSFSLRGIHKVQGEWDLLCLALNLKRMQRIAT